MTVIITADDFGLTKGITDNIYRCFGETALNNTSIVPNGFAFDYAVEKFKQNPLPRVTVHLNTIEGRPVAPPNEIPDLLNSEGLLHLGFLKTLLMFLFRSSASRRILREQFKKEYRAQILKTIHALGLSQVSVDSHQHLHMIPFLFEILIELNDEFHFSYVRVPKEEFSRCPRNWFFPLPRKIVPLIKHTLLRLLAMINLPKVRAAGIPHSTFFMGVMFPGELNPSQTNTIVGRILQKLKPNEIFELALHPGRAFGDEGKLWKIVGHRDYYLSQDRDEDFTKLKELTPLIGKM